MVRLQTTKKQSVNKLHSSQAPSKKRRTNNKAIKKQTIPVNNKPNLPTVQNQQKKFPKLTIPNNNHLHKKQNETRKTRWSNHQNKKPHKIHKPIYSPKHPPNNA